MKGTLAEEITGYNEKTYTLDTVDGGKKWCKVIGAKNACLTTNNNATLKFAQQRPIKFLQLAHSLLVRKGCT